jgi:hypothetical protein
MIGTKYLFRVAIGGVLAAGLLFATGKPASGDKDWGPSCRDRLEAARVKVDRDVARHGEKSPQVRRDVEKMEATRRWCREHHADWDHPRFDIGIYLHH